VTNPSVIFKDLVRERDFDEVWASIYNYINNIVTLVNPQKVLFLTFDGVAPRAKMN
jgi:5'-3' exoribonuclease 1